MGKMHDESKVKKFENISGGKENIYRNSEEWNLEYFPLPM
jgi:hypothetical protein